MERRRKIGILGLGLCRRLRRRLRRRRLPLGHLSLHVLLTFLCHLPRPTTSRFCERSGLLCSSSAPPSSEAATSRTPSHTFPSAIARLGHRGLRDAQCRREAEDVEESEPAFQEGGCTARATCQGHAFRLLGEEVSWVGQVLIVQHRAEDENKRRHESTAAGKQTMDGTRK